MTDENKAPAQTQVTTDPCLRMPDDLCNAGKFIIVDDAAKSLKAYLDLPCTPSANDPKHVYGHTFGLNSIRKMLYDIDVYNAAVAPGDKRIAGLRVYYGLSVRNDVNFPLDPPDIMRPDLIFMPVKDDGVDLYTINSISGTETVLSGSRPCPNQCGVPLMFIE